MLINHRLAVPGVTISEDRGTPGGRTLVFTTTTTGGGYRQGTPREGWDQREPCVRHAFDQLGITDPLFIGCELTLAQKSPHMIPLHLGGTQDQKPRRRPPGKSTCCLPPIAERAACHRYPEGDRRD